MIPFARIMEYGNKAVLLPWYRDADIMAYGSSLIGSSANNLVDYTGKTITNTASIQASTNDLPFSTQVDGSGFYLNGAWLRSAVNAISNSVLTTAWTIDYWYKFETAPVGNTFLHGSIYHSTPTPSTTSRVLLVMSSSNDPTKVTLWNNATSPVAYQTTGTNASLRATTWTHFALVYDGIGTISIYVNGVLLSTMARTITAPTGNNVFGLWGNGGTAVGSRILIERYRVRSRAVWNENFDLNGIY